MKCNQFLDLIDSYLFDKASLGKDQINRFEKHKEQCSLCSELFNEAFELKTNLKEIPVIEPQQQFFAHLPYKVKAQAFSIQKNGKKTLWNTVLRPVFAILVVSITFWSYHFFFNTHPKSLDQLTFEILAMNNLDSYEEYLLADQLEQEILFSLEGEEVDSYWENDYDELNPSIENFNLSEE